MGLFGDLIESGVGMAAAEKKRKNAASNAKAANEDYWKRLDAANFEPEYASQHAPQFQKASSPVARAYLESFLTGSNADAVQGTRAGAKFDKQGANQSFTQAYGGWDKLQAKQNAAQADNSRFQVTPITRPVQDQAEEITLKYPWAEQYEETLGRSLTTEEAEKLAAKRQAMPKGVIGKNTLDLFLKGRTAEQLEKFLATEV